MTEQTRREFCAQAGQFTSAAAVGTLLQACGGGAGGITGGSLPPDVPALTTLSATAASGGVTLSIDAGSPLASIGGAALVQSPNGLILVAHTAADTFAAVTATCTHERCTITGFTGQAFVCPCHGSRFSTNGAVQNGPATRNLRSFPTQFAGNVLTISV
jgi:Rieske Fe-S protein